MKPEEFVAKWKASTRTESSASQEHFLDLCRLLDVQTPGESDPHGDIYTFEKNVIKLDGRPGRADVWKKGCFAWEYKGNRRNLVAAYSQLKEYADALENPPLLIVSDMKEVRIHTNFTNSVVEQIVIGLADLNDPSVRRTLKWAFSEPERLRPTTTREGVTTKAAASFGKIAQKLQGGGYEPRRVAHFLNKLVFCMFAEDIGLLPERVFADIIEEALKRIDEFQAMLGDLFGAMRERHGRFGTVAIPWFNGGLFDDDDVLPLGFTEIRDLADAARLDWSAIEPSIFGTLFEQGLNPEKRKEMASLFDVAETEPTRTLPGVLESPVAGKGVGIHYTDPKTIMKIIDPVVLRPFRAEWETVKAEIEKKRTAKDKAKSQGARTRAEKAIRELYFDFRSRLGSYRVLDPACGSGNFLYLALLHLKDFDLAVLKEAMELDLPLDDQRFGPDAVLGIEINPYAAELARVTIWIGELQWQMRNAFGISRSPILGELKGIVCRDALLNPDGTEATWPKADAIIGNPPFLGGKKLKSSLTDDYVEKLFSTYDKRVPAEADLVCYWFAKAGDYASTGECARFGLVATNSIRGGANRRVLKALMPELVIFEAWSDEPWVIDGVSVRVSLISVSSPDDPNASQTKLNGMGVHEVFADLTARHSTGGVDLTESAKLNENNNVAFMGDTKGGKFDIPGATAREWLNAPTNPNDRPNADVLRPWVNGMDVTRRPRDMWIIDFGWSMDESFAALFEKPFEYIKNLVYPKRQQNKREIYKNFWWRHVEPRPGMWAGLHNLERYIATPTVAKHRLFRFFPVTVCPDHQLIVIARDDDVTFGILHSHFHELWALRMGTSLEDRPRYTPSTTFETYPFPEDLTPDIPSADYADDPRAQAIAEAARRLDELRENWLNPPDLVKQEPEVVEGYPDRILPVSEKAAKELKKRTLTNLYNERPTWLDNAHSDLDSAVAVAYGWPADMSDNDILKRLFDLNQERAGRGAEVESV